MPEQTARNWGAALAPSFGTGEAGEPAAMPGRAVLGVPRPGPDRRADSHGPDPDGPHRRSDTANSVRSAIPRRPRGRAHVTARGAIVAMLALFGVCDLLAAWMHVEVVAGLGFVGGCAVLPCLVRRHALLQVVVAPPAVFLAALLVAQALTAQGGSRHGKALSVLEGTLLTLAAIAPWLLAGTAIAVYAGLRRGLRQCLRDLLTELRAPRQSAPTGRN